MKNDAGCNSCMSLDPKNKRPGKSSGALYYCAAKKTYVDGSQNACEMYSNGYRSDSENNEIYNDGKNFSDSSPRDFSGGGLIIALILF